jgi:hypothetical protein
MDRSKGLLRSFLDRSLVISLLKALSGDSLYSG